MVKGKVYLKSKAKNLVDRGVLTIYSKWIDRVENVEKGCFVDVYLENEYVGCGFYEGIGAVGVRILSTRESPSLEEVLSSNLERAYQLRRRLVPWSSYRLVNADGDFMPGLIVDVYEDVVVLQSTSIGFDKNLHLIVNWIVEKYKPRLVYLKSDQRSRVEAGLPIERRTVYGGGEPRTTIVEGEGRFIVDVEKGQKTGFFLDQRVNRLKFSELVWEGAEVLDLYCYTGAFAIHALLNGASKAVLVEESEFAVEIAKANLEINKLKSRSLIVNSRVEEFLRRDDKSYDIVVVDPPAIIPKLELKEEGFKAYLKLYTTAISKVKPEGLLVASSCSYFLSLDEFYEVLNLASHSVGRTLRVLWCHGASLDHTFKPQDNFLRYLKTVICYVN